MEYKIAIDADSLLYKSCYRNQLRSTKDRGYTDEEIEASFDLEKAYFEMCGEIAKVRSKVFDGLHVYARGDSVSVKAILSPKVSFRNEMYPEYKANRKDASVVGIGKLKFALLARIPDMVYQFPDVEADDVVNWLARTKGYLVAAIDKDVINANPTYCYNYNKMVWIPPLPNFKIEEWYLTQALMGDATDNIKGAQGVGEKTAAKIVAGLEYKNFEGIVEYFEDEYDALMNYRLVRMDQFNGERIELWDG